jgi:hypothetical protein
MGAKTWMLVYSDRDASEKLKSNPVLDRVETDRLVKKLFANENLQPIEDGNLSYTCPPNNQIFAGCFEGISIIAAKEFGIDYPTKIDSRFIDSVSNKTVYLHAMHSVVDWFAFAKWENGKIIRALSVSPDSGFIENIGEKLSFEKAYWDGKHPVDDDYPLPFHPLDLGEEALKHFFGYQLEGYIDDTLLNPELIPLVGYERKKIWWKFW